MKMLNSEEIVTLVSIGVAIGIGIGFMIKVFLDTLTVIQGLPI